MTRVAIDPVTRIEGHMRLEVEVADGVVKDAWSSSSLFRGMEAVIVGRKPADAFYLAQRICGVCPVSHGHAATMAAESALAVKIPRNARIIRNIIEGAQFLHSHILWFYTLAALDYVDVTAALQAKLPDTYALAQEKNLAVSDFGAVQERLAKFVKGGQLSIFTNGYWGHPAYKLSPEMDLIATAHYLEALEMQAVAAEMIAIMGGKFPHFMTSIPGGSAWVATAEKLDDITSRAERLHTWITDTMVPDTLAIASAYLDASTYGKGVGNFLSWGVFDDDSMEPTKRFLPRGVLLSGQSTVEQPDAAKIVEYVEHAWYSEDSGGKNPTSGKTDIEFTSYDTKDKYSWAKAPRLDGRPMEVGPLARLLVAYTQGVPQVRRIVDDALAAIGAPGKPHVLVSLLGRIAARNLEAKILADQLLGWVNDLVLNVKGGDDRFWTEPSAIDGQGAGLWEAPRGALGHWASVKDGKIDHYQVVAPSTWNMSPRDADDVRGPLEEALIGTPIADPSRPLEALRIVHSFDP